MSRGRGYFRCVHIAIAVALVLLLSLPALGNSGPSVGEPTAPPALSGFERINCPGFGNPQNRYAWSMINFKGDIYVGTWNLRVFMNPLGLLWFINPNLIEPNLTAGTEVWKYKIGRNGKCWKRVVDNGLGDRHNMGLRKMIVWEDGPGGPAIYGTTINMYRGLEVWRTYNGVDWEVVVGRGALHGNGFGSGKDNESGRGMAVYKGHLYLGTMRKNGGELWRTADGVHWEKILDAAGMEEPGFLKQPLALADMCVFDDGSGEGEALFVGTWKLGGFSVYKSYDGVHFTRVASDGIGSAQNVGVHKLVVFQGRLWLLTVNILEGFDAYATRPGSPVESNADWELIATRGFTDRLNMYAWNARVFDNGTGERLYIGTLNLVRGFSIYSVLPDGRWAVEVGPGSAVPGGIRTWMNYGVRTLEVWDDPRDGRSKLVIGCAGMFKPVDVYLAR